MNPHALRHRILSPARLPFRHSRVVHEAMENRALFEERPFFGGDGHKSVPLKTPLFKKCINLRCKSAGLYASLIEFYNGN